MILSLVLLVLIPLWTGCHTSAPKRVNIDPKTTIQDQPTPKMVFDKTFHDFGQIHKGDKAETAFPFTNEGDAPLEIEIATSCHCTILDYPTEAIMPQEKGVIHVIFDSSEKEEQTSVIDVTIILKNLNPETGYQIVEEVKYTYEIIP